MLIHFLIFILIVFLYLHIMDQYKRGEDLEVYEMDYIDNAEFQEVCNIKQPILFDAPSKDFFEKMRTTLENHYGTYEVRVKDTVDYAATADSPDSIVLPLQSTQNLMMTDTQSHYFSEDNASFLEDTGLTSLYRSLDAYLRPTYTLYSSEDLWFGSKGTCTPLRYHTHYRRNLCVVRGRVHLKLSPWKSSRFLNPVKDYEQYDFRSQYNPWSSDASAPESQVRFLEVEANAGQIVYIPPYWWYSVKYMGEGGTYVCVQNYHSLMNCLANSPDLARYYMQNQNVRKMYSKSKEDSRTVASSPSSESKPDTAVVIPPIVENPSPVEDVSAAKEATLKLTENLQS